MPGYRNIQSFRQFNESRLFMAFDPIEAERSFVEYVENGGRISDAIPTNAREWFRLSQQIERITDLLKATREGKVASLVFGEGWDSNERFPEILNRFMSFSSTPDGGYWGLSGRFSYVLHDFIVNGDIPAADISNNAQIRNYKRSVMELINDVSNGDLSTGYGSSYWHANEIEHIFTDCGFPLRQIPPALSRIYHQLEKELVARSIINGRPARLRYAGGKPVVESADVSASRGSYILVYGKEDERGYRRLYVAKLKGGGAHKRKGSDVRMAYLSDDELYIVKEKDGKLTASRSMTTGADRAMGLSGWNVALNDKKTPYHWAAMKHKTAHELVRNLESAIRAMPNINLG